MRSSPRAAPASHRRKRRRLLLVLVPALLVGGLLFAGTALTCRPAWYQPASIDYNLLEADKRAELGLENEISAALNGKRTILIELDEAQVNRWIAARDELWPSEAPSLEPLERPRISFLDGNRVRIGALVSRSGVRVVLSATFALDVRGDQLALRCDAVHAGVLPAPRRLIEEAVRRLAGELGLNEQPSTGSEWMFPNEATWHNGRRRFRVGRISIEEGIARIRLEPV